MTRYDRYEALGIERRGPALWITLNNPPLNGLTPEMHGELARIFRDVSFDPDTRVVVLTAVGDRGFCAGGDINRMRANLDDHASWINSMHEGREIILNALECERPVIGRINGHAIGFGASLALCCDITVMVETAKIGDTHVKVGLSAGDGGSLLWSHAVGLTRARRYLLTGDLLTGREAADIGLVTEAASSEKLDQAVGAWVDRLGNGPTQALLQTKRSLNMAVRRDAQVFLDAQLGLETLTHLSQDHREAVIAFSEKRDPDFRGR